MKWPDKLTINPGNGHQDQAQQYLDKVIRMARDADISWPTERTSENQVIRTFANGQRVTYSTVENFIHRATNDGANNNTDNICVIENMPPTWIGPTLSG